MFWDEVSSLFLWIGKAFDSLSTKNRLQTSIYRGGHELASDKFHVGIKTLMG